MTSPWRTGGHKAFTLIEVMTTLGILAVLAAILAPVIATAKKSAKYSASLQNLRQLHIAFALYREEWEGQGNGPSSLGLPPIEMLLPKIQVLEETKTLWVSPCDYHGDAGGSTLTGRGIPIPFYTSEDRWMGYFTRVGEAAVYLADQSCNDQDVIIGSPLYPYRVNAIRLNGQAQVLWAKGVFDPANNP